MIEAIRNASITKRVYAISAIAGAGLVFVLAISLLQLRQTMLLDAETAIQHEVETAHGILATLQAQEVAGTMTRDQAQSAAKSMVQMLRYGNNEYFFIFDMQPRMIVNPFSPKLVGTYLGELVAQDGQHPFLEMLKKVESQGAGSIAYPWPKPGQPGSHPKLSYIKGFAPWGWVIATGVYLDDFEDAFRAMAVKLCAAVLAATILTLGCGIFVARGIVRRIGMVTDRATLLAQGDLARDVPFVSQRDALGQIARAIEVFRDAAVVKAGLEADAAVRQQREEENLKRVEQAYAAAAAGQTTVVRAMAEGLAQLAEGNLAYRLNQDFPSDYAKLKADFNSALAKMEQGMASIAGVTVSVGGGSDQIAHASDNLSRRTEQQAASLEQTAAALDAILATVKDMAAGARDTADVAVAARTAAEASSTVVRQAVEAMDKIRASSSEINNIIGVIDEIAFQTNLLALNAGVEAARAGEAGRGFAVVASEVRALAQRSASAAKEIKTLISSSAVQVENGVTFVGKTGLALKDITKKVADMAALVRNISSASAEQARGLAEINTAMTQMDQIVQENAAMVQQSAAVAHALKEESRDLSGMVGRFKIRRA